MPMAAAKLPPPLRDGDCLTREEFLRRWDAMPEMKRAELIGGIVYMASPVSNIHRSYQARLNGWLWCYAAATPGCDLGSTGTWLMPGGDVPQPDLDLRILPERGGQSRMEGKYPAGAPELIVEVSYTTSVRDAGEKLRLYERSGVREYLIAQPERKQLNWRESVNGRYREIAPDIDGWLRSRVFPGLWLDPAALWDGNLPGLAAAIQKGAATIEHTEFVRKLAGGTL